MPDVSDIFENLGQRIREAREDAGLTQEQLGERIQYSGVGVGHWERGRSRPSIDMLYKISKAVGKPLSFFLGESLSPEDREAYVKETSVPYTVNVTDMARQVAGLVSDFLPIVKVPLLGSIRAGTPLFAEENREGEVTVPRELGADFALRVKGDSMIGAGIVEGDVAVCRSVQYAQEEAQDGDIVVALVNGDEATLKYLVQDGDGWWLVPANPKYPKRKLNPQVDRIQGVVLKIEKQPPKLDKVQSVLLEAYSRAVSQYRDFDEIIKEAAEQGMTPETLHAIVRVWKMSHGTAGAEN